MNLVFPFEEPIKTASLLRAKDLKHQVELLLKEVSSGNPDAEFLDRCCVCYERYLEKKMEQAEWWSHHAMLVKPSWLNQERCEEYKKEIENEYGKTTRAKRL